MSNSYASASNFPSTDPTPIFEHFRGSYGTDLLTAAVAHFNVFGLLAGQPMSLKELQRELKIEERPAVVLTTALRAMGLVTIDVSDRLRLTSIAAEHLVPGGSFDVSDYVGLAATSPGVLEMVARLKTNQPADVSGDGDAAFIFRQGIKSAMDQTNLARHFTLALAGRAKNVAPVLAERLPMDGVTQFLDVGGGTGIYSIALLQKYPNLRATVLDRAEVLKVAAEMAASYGVAERLQLLEGDMFTASFPTDCEAILLSNILHDWDVPQCHQLVERCAEVLPVGGRLLIHDVFLNDELDGPLPIALYSAALFSLTEGRAYSQAEYRGWLTNAGLATGEMIPTLIHCGVLAGTK
ncbi:MAG: methyltransferase domain-containing protein [Planctomycetaceae bacterium]|nr:methyltransferase domain-containing protein [Planctomycetales bacterium]MCB9923521.1 methyltransferase domain-containing protein [Planctomycetaceae bacterium]